MFKFLVWLSFNVIVFSAGVHSGMQLETFKRDAINSNPISKVMFTGKF